MVPSLSWPAASGKGTFSAQRVLLRRTIHVISLDERRFPSDHRSFAHKCGLCMSFLSLTKMLSNLAAQTPEQAACIAHGLHVILVCVLR